MLWQYSWQMLLSYEKFFAVKWTPRPAPHDWLNLILGKHYFRYIHSCDFTNYLFSISQKFRRGRGEPWYLSREEWVPRPQAAVQRGVGVRRLRTLTWRAARWGPPPSRRGGHLWAAPRWRQSSFVDSNQDITQHNVTGVGILLTVILTCESLRVRRRVSGITGPMKPWRQVAFPVRWGPGHYLFFV